jgi:hypothetical protein
MDDLVFRADRRRHHLHHISDIYSAIFAVTRISMTLALLPNSELLATLGQRLRAQPIAIGSKDLCNQDREHHSREPHRNLKAKEANWPRDHS